MAYENINLHQREKAYVNASYAWCLWSLENSHILLLDFLLKWNVRSCWTMVYRSTVCPTKWAAVVLVLVESSMHFFHLKFDRMRWFTPSNNTVSDLYAVYNAYGVLYYIKQPSLCWTSLIMFSCRVFLPKIALGKRSRIHICNHILPMFTCWV